MAQSKWDKPFLRLWPREASKLAIQCYILKISSVFYLFRTVFLKEIDFLSKSKALQKFWNRAKSTQHLSTFRYHITDLKKEKYYYHGFIFWATLSVQTYVRAKLIKIPVFMKLDFLQKTNFSDLEIWGWITNSLILFYPWKQDMFTKV